MKDEDRAEWINNDEGLYDWWRQSGVGMSTFIRYNREKLTAIIQRTLSGERQTDQGIPEE